MSIVNQPCRLVAAIDFGGSATKVIYALPEQLQTPASLVMAPEAIQVSSIRLDCGQAQIVAVCPENRAWVKLGQDCWAVGHFAKRFHAHAGLNQPKFERAIYKTLAAIWVIQQRLQLPQQFDLSLSCVLPPNEYVDRDRVKRQLQIAVNGDFAMRQIAIAMIGHRNASVITFNQGMVSVFKSSNFGFIRCLEQIEQQTSGQTSERLLPAVVQWIASKDKRAFNAIARSTHYRDEEIQQLVKATQQAKADYIQALLSWLQEAVPDPIDDGSSRVEPRI